MVFSSEGVSADEGEPDRGETDGGIVFNSDPDGYDGPTTGPTTVEGIEPSTTPPDTTPEPQQPPLLRLKTRAETRSKKPHGPNRPVPSPQ